MQKSLKIWSTKKKPVSLLQSLKQNWYFVTEVDIYLDIYSNSARSEQLLVTECFLTCSCRFLISNKSEQLLFKSEKKIFGFRNMQKNEGKLLVYHNLSMYLIIVNT